MASLLSIVAALLVGLLAGWLIWGRILVSRRSAAAQTAPAAAVAEPATPIVEDPSTTSSPAETETAAVAEPEPVAHTEPAVAEPETVTHTEPAVTEPEPVAAADQFFDRPLIHLSSTNAGSAARVRLAPSAGSG